MTLNDHTFSELVDIVNGYVVYLSEREHEAESNPTMPLSISSQLNVCILLASKKVKNEMTSGPVGILSFFAKDCIGLLTT